MVYSQVESKIVENAKWIVIDWYVGMSSVWGSWVVHCRIVEDCIGMVRAGYIVICRMASHEQGHLYPKLLPRPYTLNH